MQHKRSLQYSYKIAVFANDIVMAIGAFSLGLWLTGSVPLLQKTPGATAGFIVLSLTTIIFFQTYHLYSYHFLFSRKVHLKNLVKSYCWSFLTLLIVLFLFNISRLLENNFILFIEILLACAVVLLFLSRFLWSHLLNLIMALGLTCMIVGMAGLFCKEGIPLFMTNYLMISSYFLLAILILTVNRLVLVHLILNKWLRRHFRRQVVIMGSDSAAVEIAQYIVDHNAPFYIVGIMGPRSDYDLKKSLGKKHVGTIKKIATIVERFNIDDIIITDEDIDKPTLINLLDFCTSAGINVWFPPKLLPIINVKLSPDIFCSLPMIRLCSQKNTWLFNKMKYAVDLLFTISFFIILLPLFLFIVTAIKLDSPGTVFYCAQAIGKKGKIFSMFKFRSMRADSSNKIHKEFVTKFIKGEMGKEEGEEKPLKITGDPRITRVGKILRKFSLDELPQLINVLKGEMSLVGPRPCLPYEFEMYQDWHKKRTLVHSGITGLWQIAGRSEVAFEDMILLDFYYIYNRSISLDLNILFETIFVVLGKKGAY